MKSKEEILKQINFFIAPSKKEQIFTAMEEYATQCQENMSDKKYTEEDIYMALEFGRSHSSMTDKQFIESLNKED